MSDLYLGALPEATGRLLNILATKDLVAPAVLIGGTAIALQTAHRISEDLDLRFPGGKLPRRTITGFLRELEAIGASCTDMIGEDVRDQFTNEGSDVEDHQQDWWIRFPDGQGVKLTFFAALDAIPFSTVERDVQAHGKVRIAHLDALFEMKSRVLMARKTSRDLFDLWWFLDRGGKQMGDLVRYALEEQTYSSTDHVRRRLLEMPIPPSDPGFTPIGDGAPGGMDDLRRSLAEKWSAFEVEMVADLVDDDYDSSLTP